jgi:hypothetical protein
MARRKKSTPNAPQKDLGYLVNPQAIITLDVQSHPGNK